jgi:sporulation protein YunB
MKRRMKILVPSVLGTLTLIGVVLFIWLEISRTPSALSMAEARVTAIATQALNAAVVDAMDEISYDQFISISYDSQGNVTLLQANTARMNALATQTALAAQEKIAEISSQKVSIPLGSALGIQLLSGKGPRVSASVTPAGSVTCEFLSEFSSAGINQTRHRLYIKLTASMRVIMPSRSSSVAAVTQVPVAETIIVGVVPNTYLQSAYDQLLNLVP